MRALALRFAKDQAGATAIEYAIIAAGVAVVIAAAVQGLGSVVQNEFSSIQSAFK